MFISIKEIYNTKLPNIINIEEVLTVFPVEPENEDELNHETMEVELDFQLKGDRPGTNRSFIVLYPEAVRVLNEIANYKRSK